MPPGRNAERDRRRPEAWEAVDLKAAELGPLGFSLDIGLPVDQLGAAIRAALVGEERNVTLQAVTRRGKSVVCEVLCTPLRTAEGEIQGTILMMELQEPRT